MIDAVIPGEGWGVLHLFCQATEDTDPEEVVDAVTALQKEDGHSVVSFAVLGHKADLGLMALGPDLWRLQQFQTDVTNAGLDIVDSYVSLTEVSEYAKGMPDEMLNKRLYPELPPEWATCVCFYPMSKRRAPEQNWYTLPYERRNELMHGHGKKGREYAGRVLQLITGSAGIDDWEWGVTLFARDPADLKKIVYEMRFDEASAVYAEFGPFVTGLLAPADEVMRRVGL